MRTGLRKREKTKNLLQPIKGFSSGGITLSKEAAHQIRALMKREGKSFLRFADEQAHCDGAFGYKLYLSSEIEKGDVIFSSYRVNIAVPEASLPRLKSSRIQYQEGVINELFEDLLGKGFSIENPNVKGPCKCACTKGYVF